MLQALAGRSLGAAEARNSRPKVRSLALRKPRPGFGLFPVTSSLSGSEGNRPVFGYLSDNTPPECCQKQNSFLYLSCCCKAAAY